MAHQEKLEYDIAGKAAPFLYLSIVFDDCIKRGKGNRCNQCLKSFKAGANSVKEKCHIVKEGLECSICAEICPLNAIKMIKVTDRKLKIPTVFQDICNGCGKCQYRCPVKEKELIFMFYSPSRI